MATTKNWSTTSGVGTAADGPTSTAYFAGGDATDWCVHTPPVWAKRATVRNSGTLTLYVSKPALSGTAAGAATAHAAALATGEWLEVWLVNSNGTSGTAPTGTALARTFSTFGADGAAHVMRIVFDHGGS